MGQPVSSVGYVVPPTYTAGSDKSGAANKKNPSDPNMLTTGAYGNAFELALNATKNGDGTTTDTLTYENYRGETNGTFSATSESGQGGDLATAYQTLLAAMQSNGETTSANTAQLNDAFSQLQAKSESGSENATVSGGAMLVRADGPVYFDGISAYQNKYVDSIINDLTAQLQHDSTA
jgi:hypothetical protein